MLFKSAEVQTPVPDASLSVQNNFTGSSASLKKFGRNYRQDVIDKVAVGLARLLWRAN